MCLWMQTLLFVFTHIYAPFGRSLARKSELWSADKGSLFSMLPVPCGTGELFSEEDKELRHGNPSYCGSDISLPDIKLYAVCLFPPCVVQSFTFKKVCLCRTANGLPRLLHLRLRL